jgi:hypothetical protein
VPAGERADSLSCRGGAAELQLIADRIAWLSQDTRAVHPALSVAALAARDDPAAAALADALRAHQVDAWHKRHQLRRRLQRLLAARADLLPPIARLPELASDGARGAPHWLVDLNWLTRRRTPLDNYGVQLRVDIDERHWIGRVVADELGGPLSVRLPAWWPTAVWSSGRSSAPPTVPS